MVIQRAGEPGHVRHLFQHHRIVHRFFCIFAPAERPMLVGNHAGCVQRIAISQRLGNDHTGIFFVLMLHFLRRQWAGTWNVAKKIVGVRGAERRNVQPRLCPGGGVGRVGVHNPPICG